MKKFFAVLVCVALMLCGCQKNEIVLKNNGLSSENAGSGVSADMLKKGDSFSLTGIVGYSNEPSDIGQEYCFITSDIKIDYYYTDIYDEQSTWSSDVFYTKGDDTDLLKEYAGQKISISGIFDAEVHGIPYITNITVLK